MLTLNEKMKFSETSRESSKSKRFAYVIVAIVVGGWILLLGISLSVFFHQPPDASGSHVERDEVKRLRTPKDASDISYYYSSNPFGSEYQATYKTTEASIKEFFDEWDWCEIDSPVHFVRNYALTPYDHASQVNGMEFTISDGIAYTEYFRNGGFYKAHFDRQTGYVHIKRGSH